MAALSQWIAAGGVVITEGGTSAVFTDYGVTRGVDIVPAKQLRATGGIYRAVTKDARSPIAYGYGDTLAVYFNQSPLFQVDTSTDIPEDQDPDLTAQQPRLRPRGVMSVDRRRGSLVLRGCGGWGVEGGVGVGFNTILNWNELGGAWPTAPKPSTGAVAAADEGP